MILVEGLRFRYGDRTVLDGVDFQVRPAEIFAVLGPNGSGKSTLFKILVTLLEPSVGRVRVAGFDVRHQARQVRRSLGAVFQSSTLDPKLSLEQNLRVFGQLYGLRGAVLRERVRQELERAELDARRADLVETLSGGLRRRLELARALLHQPRLLILDEPTAGLDPAARIRLWEHLEELRACRGLTVCLTTHLLEEAERCDRLLLMDRGRVVAEGTPAELKASVGGDVVVLETRDAEGLRRRVRERFGWEVTAVDGQVRIKSVRGHQRLAELMEAFPSEIVSASVRPPTLEDVFVDRTGGRWA